MDKILVIDDVQQNVELMVNYLRNTGYEVITANDGFSGIKKAELFKPDLIVLDLIMPKMSGFDVCKTLKSNNETKDIIILVVTAMASKESRTRAYEVGADEYMEKNFDKGMFLAKVKSLLRVKLLSDKLKENFKVLEEQNKQFELQLEMAKHVQSALVKEVSFRFNDISIASCYKPAMGVGGDLYDIVTLFPDKVAVFMADVSGHGVSAALLTSMLKVMFRNFVDVHRDPSMLLKHMNEDFCKIFSEAPMLLYSCAFYAIIDLRSKEISFSNAGAALPLFVKNKERTVSEIQITGKPLGMLNDSVYTTKSISYGKGDMFFIYTDGLCDSLYKNDNEGFIRILSELLLDATDDVNPISSDELIELIQNQFYNMNESAKYENDDVSMIVCRME